MHSSKKLKVKVPISPMIDVIFLMIFFFVLSAVMDDSFNENIDMVKVKDLKPSDTPPLRLHISVNKNGDVMIGGSLPLEDSAIKNTCSQLINKWGNGMKFIVTADRNATHEMIDRTLKQLKESGARHIVLTGEHVEK